MIVLIDSSVWIEYFQKRPRLDPSSVDLLLEERRVATCLPIKTELLSGKMTPTMRVFIASSLNALNSVDPDWNSEEVWNQIAESSIQARKATMGVPGIVDRMILVAAKESNAQLWTLDKGLQRFAALVPVTLFIKY